MHGIAKLREINNYDSLTKEDLIFILLKSESNLAERNYMKYFNNNTNDKIKGKINKIRLTLVRLGNIVPKKYKNILRKDLYEIENKKKTHKGIKRKDL